jgi:hypothetical protein
MGVEVTTGVRDGGGVSVGNGVVVASAPSLVGAGDGVTVLVAVALLLGVLVAVALLLGVLVAVAVGVVVGVAVVAGRVAVGNGAMITEVGVAVTDVPTGNGVGMLSGVVLVVVSGVVGNGTAVVTMGAVLALLFCSPLFVLLLATP